MILISRLFTHTYKRSFRNEDHFHPLSTTSLDALGGEWKGCVRLVVLGLISVWEWVHHSSIISTCPIYLLYFTITQLAYFLYYYTIKPARWPTNHPDDLSRSSTSLVESPNNGLTFVKMDRHPAPHPLTLLKDLRTIHPPRPSCSRSS